MSIDNMDDYAVNLADAYAKDAYQKGYEQGGMDAVKHGYWIDDGYLIGYLRCSHCYSSLCWNRAKRPKFCPNCGCKMDAKPGGDYLDGEKPAKG